MKTIERKRYYQPVTKIIEIHPLPFLTQNSPSGDDDNTGTHTDGGLGAGHGSRSFIFEDEE